ncbi:histidinol-phosphatase [Campylobacter hyointestinalis subsp. hyointestinalis]|uniref:histidinol-phosphatase n=1 Tax=Campylobacter hyointestinalis TaxID=198 RepID=UPI0007282785|nr:histidinol-phosphatase [Campylobacter hyointestinalis]PPB58840.1 histidinol phosphate phosphatase [Campylobacter hyointestinalis subsp. hyointestinalis]PPB69134.1 histidinol phosphate phosphatase [Campylobacter hyointestinalis subsp. hyointestinalis]QCU00145.1 histidinol-phosphatase [Campylobacter hyointestinalis subsp. hyointestinalis]CUU68705.1 histidinol phosphate phosphatase HisJ [Campylobacter hyointestinalis subsp. hyointestinalis]CUU69872.1 histidinol phosphate phosphatase HisJ [Camp
MLIDLHNHTELCNHASGTPLQYAKKAYEMGCKYYGFSDHNPMKFDEKCRMKFEQMSLYKQMIDEVKAKFDGKMEVLFGYEVDFLEGFMDERVLSVKCDHLIGSVHFLNGWGFDNPEFIGEYKNKDINQIWEQYFNAIENLAKCGKFDIVGHIDLIKVFNFKPTKEIKSIAKNAIKEIKKANLVVELNSAGYRKPANELYPSDDILEMLAEFNIPITFSSDAHEVAQVGQNMDKSMKKAKEFGFSEAAIFVNRDRQMIEI